MALKVNDYLPNYLKNFEDVEGLCGGIERQCFILESALKVLVRKIRLDYSDGERWEKLVYTEPNFGDTGERIGVLFNRVAKPTPEDYSHFLKFWLPDERFSLTYDADSNTFNLVIEMDPYYSAEKAKMIRNLFPMNAKVVIEKL